MVTTAAKRARKKSNKNRGRHLEALAAWVDEAAAQLDEDVPESPVQRPESEKAAATQALAATRRFLKKVKGE